MKRNNLLNYSLALLISSFVVTGCSTPNTTDNKMNNTNTSSPTTVISGSNGNTNSTTNNTSTNISSPTITNNTSSTPSSGSNSSTQIVTQTSSNQEVNDIASYMEDESTLSDSSTIMSKSGFSTKALLGDIKTTTELGTKPVATTTTTTINKDSIKEKTQETLNNAVESGKIDAATAKKIEASVNYMLDNQVVKTELIAQGVITVDASGTVTSVDKVKLKSYVKTTKEKIVAVAKANEDKIKAKVADFKIKFNAQLEAKTGVTTEELKNKLNKVLKSDIVKVDNPDGGVTQTMTVNFTSPNGKVNKDNKIVRTADSKGNLLSLEQYFTVDNSAYNKNVTKTLTVNSDGSRKVVTNSLTTWKKSGRIRQITEERTINAEGNGTGTGTITITEKGKEPVVKTLNVTISSGKVSMASGNPDTGYSVKVEQAQNAQAQVIVKEEGKADSTSTVNVETVSEVEASAT